MFLSEEVFNRLVSDAVEEARYEARLEHALSESRKDFEEGRYYTTREELLAAVESMRAEHATA